MKEILMGIVSGMFTATGMGGGTILIVLLTFLGGISQQVAQATNLIFFIPTSIVAIILNIKNKNVDIKTAIIVSAFGIIGAVIGANIAMNLEVNNLKKYFGYFLALIAMYEIYSLIKEYIICKKRNTKNKKNRRESL